MLYEMKCPSGHISWVLDTSKSGSSSNSNSSNNRSSDNKCQICNFFLIYTGETRIEIGKILKKYKCSNGHINWKTN